MPRLLEQLTTHVGEVVECGEHHTFLVWLQTCTVTIEISVPVSWEDGNWSNSRFSYSALGQISKGSIPYFSDTLNHDHFWSINNYSKLEIVCVSVSGWMVKIK